MVYGSNLNDTIAALPVHDYGDYAILLGTVATHMQVDHATLTDMCGHAQAAGVDSAVLEMLTGAADHAAEVCARLATAEANAAELASQLPDFSKVG